MLKLTIGIPFYNRYEEFSSLIIKLLFIINKSKHINLLIVDDSGSSEVLNSKINNLIIDNDQVFVIKHNINKGYKSSFLSIFENSTGDYLMILEDDGDICEDEIFMLLDFLKNHKSAIIISPFKYADGQIIRKLNGVDYKWNYMQYTAHAPGLVYGKVDVISFLNFYKKYPSYFTNQTFNFYPQVFFFFFSYLEKRNISFYPRVIACENKVGKPSQLVDENKEAYWSHKNRVIQRIDFLKFAENCLGIEDFDKKETTAFYKKEKEIFYQIILEHSTEIIKESKILNRFLLMSLVQVLKIEIKQIIKNLF
jgi:hypothetical protein